MLVELLKVKKNYIDKEGNERSSTQFYLKLDNNITVRIEPYKYIKDGKIENSTYKELNLIAKEV